MTEERLEVVRKTLNRIFYDAAGGFGSIAKTYKAAKAEDPSITMADVRNFIAKQEVRQVKKRRADNSFVAFGPREQFQVDLADFGAGQRFRYAFVAIDIFTKKLAVVPIENKLATSCAEAFEQVLAVLDIPNEVYSDEGGEFSGPFDRKLEYYKIEHILSKTPAPFVERAIRTLKEGVRERLAAFRMAKTDWWKAAPIVVAKYNDEEHTVTKETPNDVAALDWAANRDKILEVRAAIGEKAHHNRNYYEISVGDRVKVVRKPGKYGEFKNGFVAWSAATFRVEKIAYAAAGPVFHLEGRVRPLRLHEILKVDAVEKPAVKRVVGKQGAEALMAPPRPKAKPAAPRRIIVGKQKVAV